MIKMCCSQESCYKAANLTSHAGSNLQMELCLLVKDAEHISKKKKETERERENVHLSYFHFLPEKP